MELAVATLTENPAGANHSFRSSLEVELTNLTELEVTCNKLVAIIKCRDLLTEKHQQENLSSGKGNKRGEDKADEQIAKCRGNQ